MSEIASAVPPSPVPTTPAAGRPPASAVADIVALIGGRLGERITTNTVVCRQHGQTTTWLETQAPDAVAFPHSTDEVAFIVRTCAAAGVPVIAHGTGTSLEGHVNAPYGGICIDLTGMNRIVAVRPDDLDCTVEPGVTRRQLNDYLRDQGLFFPIDPGADASLGGMVSTRASGTNAVRYGTMRENVLALEVVLADGTVIDTARRARKSSAGYDLTRLIVGAEGTLGIVTGVTLRLHGLPEAIIAGVSPFASLDAACRAVIATIQSGIPVARIELLDNAGIRAVNLHSHLALPEQPHLFVEFHGSPAGTAEQAETFGAIVAEYGGGALEVAHHPEDRSRLWHARHEFYFAVRSLRPGTEPMVTDVCVPISRLAACIEETMADVAATGLVAAVAGHVGDGNFHVQAMVDTASPDEIAAAEGFLKRLAHRALAMDGTCTGEHGVGQGKIAYLDEEHGAGLAVMRAVKLALDPAGILNPGKIIGTQRLVAPGVEADFSRRVPEAV